HACGKVTPRRAKHGHPASGHVFAPVVTHGLDDRVDAGVADGEAFARHAADEHFAARSPVKSHVANDNVLLRHKGGAGRRIQNDFSARQSLAEVIVGVALKREGHATRHESTKALARAALEGDLDRVFGQTFGTVAAGDFAADDGAYDAVDVPDREGGTD